jgi:hypothetical protein
MAAGVGFGLRGLLQRLLDAMPTVEGWIVDLHARHAAAAVPASAAALGRVARSFPRSILDEARAVSVDRTPFPPVSALGLPEFAALEAMPAAGITFGHMYFLDRRHAREATHFHELVHVVQWSTLGVSAFLPTYAVGIATRGYEASPLEAMAYDLEGRFLRGEPLTDLVDRIARHAHETRAAAAAVFQSSGLTMPGLSRHPSSA